MSSRFAAAGVTGCAVGTGGQVTDTAVQWIFIVQIKCTNCLKFRIAV